MKKVYRVVLIGFLLAYCHLVLAQQTEKKEVKGNLHTVIHLKNGETAEGYLQNYFTVVDSVITHEKITWGQIEGCDYYQPFTMQLTI